MIKGTVTSQGADLVATINTAIADAKARLVEEPMILEVSCKAAKRTLDDGTASLVYEVEVTFSDKDGWWGLPIVL